LLPHHVDSDKNPPRAHSIACGTLAEIETIYRSYQDLLSGRGCALAHTGAITHACGIYEIRIKSSSLETAQKTAYPLPKTGLRPRRHLGFPCFARMCTLKTRSCMMISLLVLWSAASPAGQVGSEPAPHTPFLESRQGNHPNGPDLIGHRSVSKGATLQCYLVEVYDETNKASTACVVKFGDGQKYTLAFHRSMRSPQDGELYLEWLGGKPRRCGLKVN